MRCPSCNTPVTEESKFCHHCGLKLIETEDLQSNGSDPQQSVEALPFEKKVELVREELAGLDCGRCGYEKCSDHAEAIVRGESPHDACLSTSKEEQERIKRIVGSAERVGWEQQLWRTCTSVRLAIGLISVIALLSIIGTLIPQGLLEDAYADRYGPNGSALIRFFQIDHLYSSWYFLGLLAMLGVNTLSCLIKRLRVSLRLVKGPRRHSPSAIRKLKNSIELATPERASHAFDSVQRVLNGRGFRVSRQGEMLYAQKRLFGRFGVDVFHASLILFLIGALAGGYWGFEDFRAAHKGDIFNVPNADFQIRVDDLWTENYAGSVRIKDWYSKLTVLEDGQEIKTETIEVNHPLTYKGISFYQSSFGTDWLFGAELTFRVERVDDSSVIGEYEVQLDKTFDIEAKEGLTAKFVGFFPDFVMSSEGPANRSRQLNNPAAFMELYQGEQVAYRGWVFVNFPDTQIWVASQSNTTQNQDPEAVQSGDHSGDMPYRLVVVGMHAPEYTGLRIANSPGIWLIYISFVFMAIGLLLHYYLPPRWVWAVIERGQVSMGGIGRDEREFTDEFESLAETTRSMLGHDENQHAPEVERKTMSVPDSKEEEQ